MKSESALFQEIFDGSSVTESLGGTAPAVDQRPEAALPTDSEVWPFTLAPSATATREIADRDFIKSICGWEPPVAQAIKPQTDIGRKVLDDSARYFRRTQELAKQEPRRRRELAALVDRWARARGFPQSVQPELDRVKESMAICLRQILMEVS
jgi:hypothetical protein